MDRVDAKATRDTLAMKKFAKYEKAAAKAKKELSKNFGAYKRAAEKLRKAAIDNMLAERAFNTKPSVKKQETVIKKKAKLIKCVMAYNEIAEKINQLTEAIHDNYQNAKTLMFDVDMNEAVVIVEKFDVYNKKISEKIDKIQDPLLELDIPSVD